MTRSALRRLSPLASDLEQRFIHSLIDYARSGFTDPGTPSWDELPLRFAARHRVLTAVPDAWVPAEQATEVGQRVEAILGLQMRLEWAAIEAVRVLGHGGIDTRVLKGMASSFLDYPSPALRQAGDVDLLVRPGRLADAAATLLDAGYTLRPDQSLVAWSRGLTLVDPDGLHIDLHARLLHRQPREHLHFDDDGESIMQGRALALRSTDRLAHAAMHVVATDPSLRRLSGLVDVAALLGPDPVPADVLARARTLRAERMVGVALAAAGADIQGWPQPNALERRAFLGTSATRLELELWNHGPLLPWRVIHIALSNGVAELAARESNERSSSHGGAPSPPSGRIERWHRNADVRTRRRGDDLYLLEPRSGTAAVVAGSGPMLWECLDVARSPKELADAAFGSAQVGVARPADSLEHIESFLHEMAAGGYVVAAAD